MRRSLVALAVMTVTALAVAVPASAATGQVTRFRTSGTRAEAFWFTKTKTSFTGTTAIVVKTKQGTELIASMFQGKLVNGQFVGGTDTSLRGPGGTNFVTTGFSFAINAPKLTSASVRGSGLPARQCTVDADGNPTSCRRITISVNVTWTGHGALTRSVSNARTKTAGFSLHSHFAGTTRAATATGTIAGHTLTAKQLEFADLGIIKSGEMTRCIGSAC
jgi:hypothetical protein